jgi:phosphonoacetate hydrolase
MSFGQSPGISLSVEYATKATKSTSGIEWPALHALLAKQDAGFDLTTPPPIYSGESSQWALWCGVALVRAGLADLLYLSLTDYIQHSHAPADEGALTFYAGLDRAIGALDALGVNLCLTADHGMNAKQRADGSPNVIYLESRLRELFPNVEPAPRVILPITDPYVAHHGALGSFAAVHFGGMTSSEAQQATQYIRELPGITEVYDRADTVRLLELPEDRIGDLSVLSARNVAIGRSPEYHDLSVLASASTGSGLRSHGGRYEEMVPMILSRPLTTHHQRLSTLDPRNFDAFDYLLNGSVA